MITAIVKAFALLLLCAWLLGPQGLRALAEQNFSVVGVLTVLGLLVVAFGPQKGSNALLQWLFAWSGIIALVVLAFMYASLEQRAKAYVVNRLCNMKVGQFELTRPVCRFFGAVR